MFRTRNYAVGLGLTALVAIFGASAYTLPDIVSGPQVASVAFVNVEQDSFSASMPQPESISREDNLVQMRKKIASKKNIAAVTADEPVQNEEPVEPVAATDEEKGEMRCSNYGIASIAWSSAGVFIEEVEGARLVYKEGTPTMVGSTSVPTRNTLAQLPLRSAPTSAGNCISSDVIGISVQGALMRNSEVVAYSSLGSGALVGYALDGFPIYSGSAAGSVDVCGGASVGGQYRYYVGANQETIINCFSATPITL